MSKTAALKTKLGTIPMHRFGTIVIGSGAASLNAADRLDEFGVKDCAIITEGLTCGTSLNTGSDKQTYYKMSVSSPTPDSPYDMAQALFGGGSMHGDLALVESIGSLEGFYHLVNIGVPFPTNRLGAYVGYKTDHDPKERATSIGPYTSKAMVEHLLAEVKRRNMPLFDNHQVISLVVDKGRAVGALAINKGKLDSKTFGLEAFLADNVVFGVGGPGALYESSVYPVVHTGAIGLAIEAGAEAVNLTESQYGLASTQFRWNVSGTYQQVIPRYFSSDKAGGDEREFLNEYFPTMGLLCSDVFLKGYQWPFDPRKIKNLGSSIIDILVYVETVIKGRRVYMDFRKNPVATGSLKAFDFNDLSDEALTYLQKSGAVFGTPIERLAKMNPKAIELYKVNGIDLYKEPLEVAVCAQHNNGGLAGDIWWESTNIKRLFPVGEVNGSHGVYRPGGSALNSGQVGSTRAARKIAALYNQPDLDETSATQQTANKANELISLMEAILDPKQGKNEAADNYRTEFQKRMSANGAHIRDAAKSESAEKEAIAQLGRFSLSKVKTRQALLEMMTNRHLSLAHAAYLSAINHYLQAGGGSRGSAIVLDPNGEEIHPSLGETWRYKTEDESFRNRLQTTRYENGFFVHGSVERRPIPEETSWFETTWAEYRDKTIYR